ncbi:MAG: hypothetical protein KDJ38_03760 [Gammaproteobacteria bacterium]|nr:hypothetical protein [Gammaproteobacteria bacterium]
MVRLNASGPGSAGDAYFFDEDGIKVSATHIEFGKYTYVLKYLAAIKRSEKKPSRKECQLAIVFTIIALLTLLIYIFIGQLKFGLGAVVYLSFGLLAFLVSSLVCKQMKASYTLTFSNAQGELIKSVTGRDKQFILRLEKAVKEAISRSVDDGF